MKKLFLFVVLCSGILFAQPLSGVKLYINPGHGGYDSNDRYIAATGFWESQSNLEKGLYLQKMLTDLGAAVVMSRTQNRTQDDRALSEIVADANANNVDYFHSIHSNAYDSKTNYLLILFQGKDNAPTYTAAKTMAGYQYDEIADANRLKTHYSGINIRGDFDFYGTGQPYLGVFKNLGMPGTLSEGSFHDYIPESWRLRNAVYKKNEAWAIARAFLSFYGKPGYDHGIVAGILRDPDKTIDYYHNPNYGESKKPLNKIKMTLEPGSRIYEGDEFNNGFFMFDSLTPGEYKLYYECQGYYKDSALVTVKANEVVFADKYLNYDTTMAPVVVKRSPEGSSSTTISPVVITFDRKMSASDAESAFSITPAVPGVFTWGEERILVFTPSIPLLTTTQYKVMISTAAKSKWGVPLSAEYSFTYTTNNRRKLTFEKSYPAEGQQDISTTVQFRLQFDNSIGSAGGQIWLYDNSMNVLPVAGARMMTEDNKGVVYFEPKNPLLPGLPYKVVVLGGIKDVDGYPLIDTVAVNFITSDLNYISGVVVDSFETAGKWKNPGSGPGTTGVDTNTSSFRITYSKKLFGKNSARLAYAFTGNGGGICQYYNTTGFDLNAGSGSEFGIWVWGDYSNNVIEYWFTSDGSTENKISADTLNWTGWKLCRVPLSSVQGSSIKFHSIVVKQISGGMKSSIIYADDAQYDIVLPVDEEQQNTPAEFSLMQNYPNPFNPATKIKFSIPAAQTGSVVRLNIYDILGKEVRNLINRELASGSYEIEFNADNLPSGMYIYKLEFGGKVLSKKMLLLK